MISNKHRFWTGIGLFGGEVLSGTIFALTLLDWSWITERILLMTSVGFFFILYNILATIFVWSGSSKEKK